MAKRLTARELLRTRVNELLRLKKMTGSQLAKGIRKTESQISLFLRGKRSVSIEAIDEIAQFFTVPVQALFQETPIAISEAVASRLDTAVLSAFRAADMDTRISVMSTLKLAEYAEVVAIAKKHRDILEAMIGAPVDSPPPESVSSGRRGRHA